ncbi:Ectopic P granules protein 5 [Homalodisca vitripennis]|nr:Ectopic P granules protein 5 [Homalodisca vitripennis]
MEPAMHLLPSPGVSAPAGHYRHKYPTPDNSLRAAATLKLTTLPASALSIYRWSQQALDTSVDHPVLPLLWQRFFTLYFTRVVTQTG